MIKNPSLFCWFVYFKKQLAYEYARRGAMLSLVDIKKENLEAVAYKAKCLGAPDVTIIGADVSKEQDCKRFVDETVNHFGHCTYVYLNFHLLLLCYKRRKMKQLVF